MSNGNGHRWSKFWWQDHQNDEGLRACSLAARGFWVEMLSVMHRAELVGHLLINGRPATLRQMAAIAGCSEREAKTCETELEEAGVFSRTTGGIIYCRRMVRDAAASEAGREHAGKRDYGVGTTGPPSSPPNGVPNGGPIGGPSREANGGANGEANGGANGPPNGPPIFPPDPPYQEAEAKPVRKKESKFKILTSVSPVLARVAAACETPPPGTFGAELDDKPVSRAAQAEVRNLHRKVVSKLAAIARPATKYAEHSVAEQIAASAPPPPPLAIPPGLEASVRAGRRALAEHAKVVLANGFPP